MIWTFEIFRFYFLICVMFTHLIFLVEPVNDRISTIMNFGPAAVYYFFILSAFFMYFTLKKNSPENWKNAIKLIIKRMMKYFVLYWIRLVLVVAYYFILIFYSRIHLYSISEVLSQFFTNLLMIDVYTPVAAPDVGWYFRSLIFCCVFAYPIYKLVNKLSGKKRIVIILLCFLVHFVVSHFSSGTQFEEWKIYYNPYLHIFDFFIGMSIAREVSDQKEKGNITATKTTATLFEILALGLIVIAQFVMPYRIQWLMPYRYSIYLVIMSILIYVFSKQAGYLSITTGNHPILSWLHKHFFSLYIFHDIMIKYTLMVPWSNSKYANLAAAIVIIVVLDELIFLLVSKRLSNVINQHIG